MLIYDNCQSASSTTTNYYGDWYENTTASSADILCKNNWKRAKTAWTLYDDCSDTSTLDDWNTIDYGTNAVSMTAKQVYRQIREVLNGNSWYYKWDQGCTIVRSDPKRRLREILQSRQAPLVISSRKSMPHPSDIREQRARETLRRVLGDDKFRRFIRHGFVSVKAKSGLVYQIFPAHGITNVYREGEKVERLCVVLRGDFPPTDSLIMRYLLILNDERDFRKHAIEHKVYPKKMVELDLVKEPESLNEIWNKMRKVA